MPPFSSSSSGSSPGIQGDTTIATAAGVKGITTSSAAGVYGVSHGTGPALKAYTDAATWAATVDNVSADGGGLFANVTGDNAVALRGNATGSSNVGVVGYSTTGTGVGGWATEDGLVGVAGYVEAQFGTAVFGYAVGVRTSGVHGETDGNGQYGVEGRCPGILGAGVYGTAQGDLGIGVLGEADRAEDIIAVLGEAHGADSSISNKLAGVFNGDVGVTGNLSKTAGGFLIDHPLDPANRLLEHSFVESSERKNLYDGIGIANEAGEVAVELPSYFEALNTDIRYQLTALGKPAPELHIKHELESGRFTIGGAASGQRISWQVTGNRKDAYSLARPLIVEREKNERERGRFRHPELHGAPREQAILFRPRNSTRRIPPTLPPSNRTDSSK